MKKPILIRFPGVRTLLPYRGSTRIVPGIREQILPTRERAMEEDLTVAAVPYAEEENAAGGITARIACGE